MLTVSMKCTCWLTILSSSNQHSILFFLIYWLLHHFQDYNYDVPNYDNNVNYDGNYDPNPNYHPQNADYGAQYHNAPYQAAQNHDVQNHDEQYHDAPNDAANNYDAQYYDNYHQPQQ